MRIARGKSRLTSCIVGIISEDSYKLHTRKRHHFRLQQIAHHIYTRDITDSVVDQPDNQDSDFEAAFSRSSL